MSSLSAEDISKIIHLQRKALLKDFDAIMAILNMSNELIRLLSLENRYRDGTIEQTAVSETVNRVQTFLETF